MKPDSYDAISKAFYYYKCLFDRTINSGTKKYAKKDDIIKYADIQINSSLYDNATRTTQCREIKLISAIENTWQLSGEASAGVTTAASLWDSLQF